MIKCIVPTLLKTLSCLGIISLIIFQNLQPTYGDILVGDRLTNSVFRYSDSGQLLGTVLFDNTNLDQPSGITLSPDGNQLYVTSSLNNSVVRYDYNRETGTAANATVFATTGLQFPSSIRFNPAGTRIYVANLGGTGVAQFNLDGTPAGPAITGAINGGTIFSFSGIAFAPDGRMLVGGFQDLGQTVGAVASSDAGINVLADFVPASSSLNGAASLLVNGNDLYVSSLFAGTVQRFNATTGALDGSFSITGLPAPQSILLAPDGNGLLVSTLGIAAGGGSISRYSFDGTLLGEFAPAGGGGFSEATSLAYVTAIPEPHSLAIGGITALAYVVRRRLKRKS